MRAASAQVTAPFRRRGVAALVLLAALAAPSGFSASTVAAAEQPVTLGCTTSTADAFATVDNGAGGTLPSAMFFEFSKAAPDSLLRPVNVAVDQDAPAIMNVGDAPTTVTITGTVSLLPAILQNTPGTGVTQTFDTDVELTFTARGSGVESRTTTTMVTLTDTPGSAPTTGDFSVTLQLVPTSAGGTAWIGLDADVALKLDQAVDPAKSVGTVTLGTARAECTSLDGPYTRDAGDGAKPNTMWQAAPIVDLYVARPDGVVARTDRGITAKPSMTVDVLANDEASGSGRVLDPTSLSITGLPSFAHATIEDGKVVVTLDPMIDDGSIYDPPTRSGASWRWASTDQTGWGQYLLGQDLGALEVLSFDYRVCDDGDPAACADGHVVLHMARTWATLCDDGSVAASSDECPGTTTSTTDTSTSAPPSSADDPPPSSADAAPLATVFTG